MWLSNFLSSTSNYIQYVNPLQAQSHSLSSPSNVIQGSGAQFFSGDHIAFGLFAPAAHHIKLQIFKKSGELNREVEMQPKDGGFWQANEHNIEVGTLYHYLIDGKGKLDPYGYAQKFLENHPQPFSVIVDQASYQWQDEAWMRGRIEQQSLQRPLNIYELHLTTWKRNQQGALPYRQLAVELTSYCKEMGYTHVELMGAMEHPFEGSWGYQVTGFFAPNHRLGSVDDFKWMVDYLHQQNIGVILDWIPAHFANDAYSLSQFDGTALYESTGLARKLGLRHWFYQWGTCFFNFSNHQVHRYLLDSAAFWLEKMHIDGLRVDAVSAILKAEVPCGGAQFLQELNEMVHQCFPGVLTISEDGWHDSRNTQAIQKGGLGFDLMWNIKWADELHYFMKKKSKVRSLYSFIPWNNLEASASALPDQPALLLFSHDSVGSTTLFQQVPGENTDDKYAFIRVLLSYQMALPGKKITFMGTEIGQQEPWAERMKKNYCLDWGIVNRQPLCRGLQEMVKDLNHLYLSAPLFWTSQVKSDTFQWVDRAVTHPDLISYRLKSLSNLGYDVLCIHSLATLPISILLPSKCTSLFCSQEIKYGGTIQYPVTEVISNQSLSIPPLTTWLIKIENEAPS